MLLFLPLFLLTLASAQNARPDHPEFQTGHTSMWEHQPFLAKVNNLAAIHEISSQLNRTSRRASHSAMRTCGLRSLLARESSRNAQEISTTRSGLPLQLGEPFILLENHTRSEVCGSQSDDHDYYTGAARDAALDANAFDTFRQHPNYTVVVGHVPKDMADGYLDLILAQCPGVLACLPQLRSADTLGGAWNIEYYPEYGLLSGDVIRYIYVVVDLMQHFGDLTGFDIVEIGGGWGGQCKAIHDLFEVSSYTIVDIPEALALASKWLGHFPSAASRTAFASHVGGYRATEEEQQQQVTKALERQKQVQENPHEFFVNEVQTDETNAAAAGFGSVGDEARARGVFGSVDDDAYVLRRYDLCISNYAFDELPEEWQERYWNRLIVHCDRGYITDNEFPRSTHIEWREQMRRLKELGKDVWLEPQQPGDQRGHLLLWR